VAVWEDGFLAPLDDLTNSKALELGLATLEESLNIPDEHPDVYMVPVVADHYQKTIAKAGTVVFTKAQFTEQGIYTGDEKMVADEYFWDQKELRAYRALYIEGKKVYKDEEIQWATAVRVNRNEPDDHPESFFVDPPDWVPCSKVLNKDNCPQPQKYQNQKNVLFSKL
jgi:hypothetical protein